MEDARTEGPKPLPFAIGVVIVVVAIVCMFAFAASQPGSPGEGNYSYRAPAVPGTAGNTRFGFTTWFVSTIHYTKDWS